MRQLREEGKTGKEDDRHLRRKKKKTNCLDIKGKGSGDIKEKKRKRANAGGYYALPT